jgi:hypothetical protein
MAFEELKDNTEEIQDRFKNLVDSNIAYYKLWGFKVAMKSTSLLINFVLILICVVMVLIFLSIAAALGIGILLNNYAYGFLIVAGIYLLLVILLYFVKDSIVEGSLIKRFSEIFFND